MNFASSLVLLGSILLTAACTGGAARPAQSATAPIGSQKQGQVVELRHFYLLSPGPKATLVVTRSDVSSAAP